MNEWTTKKSTSGRASVRPSQWVPLPLKPGLQSHEWLPSVLVQSACSSHPPSFSKHSLISEYIMQPRFSLRHYCWMRTIATIAQQSIINSNNNNNNYYMHLCRITHWRLCHRGRCSGQPGSGHKIAKYDELASTHIFYPVAIETGGTLNHWVIELVREIGRRTTLITGETRESIFSISAGVNSPPKGKCGRLPQHLWLRLDAVAVIACLVQCL